MHSNGLLLGDSYDDLRLRMEGCGGAEKFWSFGPKLPNRPPYLCDYIRSPSSLHHGPHCILPSTLFCHHSLPSPLTGRAAQPPEFSPHDVVSLTWSRSA